MECFGSGSRGFLQGDAKQSNSPTLLTPRGLGNQPSFFIPGGIAMVPKSCLECGVAIPSGYRCVRHNKIRERIRNAQPKRQLYKDPLYMAYVKGSVCNHCGSAQNLTRDHVISIRAGGGNNISNLQTLCLTCNSAKGARPDASTREGKT
jgi:5-methylcytosine-specific restriction endonuclease McrA